MLIAFVLYATLARLLPHAQQLNRSQWATSKPPEISVWLINKFPILRINLELQPDNTARSTIWAVGPHFFDPYVFGTLVPTFSLNGTLLCARTDPLGLHALGLPTIAIFGGFQKTGEHAQFYSRSGVA